MQHEILNTPVTSSHDLQANLIPMPNVLMDSNGRIHIAGARQGKPRSCWMASKSTIRQTDHLLRVST